jgi:beta-1,4-mannosyl-glycoprotein beta-1,4-N-acetylglucosaminyltransferase
MKEIVVAAYNRNLSWLNDISDIKKTVYRKGIKVNDNEIVIEQNVGRDVHTFFHHIYTNYDNLSDLTYFVQDYPFDHCENLIDIINNDSYKENAVLNIGGYYGFHYNTLSNTIILEGVPNYPMLNLPDTNIGEGKSLTCLSNGYPHEAHKNVNLDKYWNILFNKDKPTVYEFIPGGHFCIKKEQILLRSRDFYKKIVDLLLNDPDAPWMIERLECYIFNPKYKIVGKIYDCVPFFNELEILEIRLELLYDYVDHFIISECDYTFSGLPKSFNFEENKDRFSKYMDKIIYVKHTNTFNIDNLTSSIYSGKKRIIYQRIINRLEHMKTLPDTEYGVPHWCRDYYHKELTMLATDICEDDDLILFGDLDEIPNPEKIKFDGNSYVFNQYNMIYYINTESNLKWHGTYLCKYSDIIENSFMYTREKRMTFEVLDNTGWHLSFMGGSEKIKEKIKSYGHQEFNNSYILNNVESNMKVNNDILCRGTIKINNININDYYPLNIISLVKEKFNYLINV